MTRAPWVLGLLAVLSVGSAGCSGETDAGEVRTLVVEPLDPTREHFGHTYSELAAAWIEWIYQSVVGPDCIDPVADVTGEHCGIGQDPASSVFFLAGNYGGTVVRDACVVPDDKALFFPLVNQWGDPGGVPAPHPDYQEAMSTALENLDEGSYSLTVDGASTPGLERFRVAPAPFTYTLPPAPNIYDCGGTLDVSGTYSGWTTGYFVLLPPLGAGAHVVHFTAGVPATGFSLDVAYDTLTVQP